MRKFMILMGLLGACLLQPATLAQPPIEAYGNLPYIRSMAMAPDGSKLGYLNRQEDGEGVLVYDLQARQIMGGIQTDSVKARSVSFAGPDYALLSASETTQLTGFKGKFEYSGAFAYNLKSNKIRQLLRGSDDLYPAQSGLGDIVGLNADGKYVYMPAYVGSSDPTFGLMRVSLSTGRGWVYKRGRHETRDWFVDVDGTVLAREDYDDKRNLYTIHAARDGKLKEIFRAENAAIPPISLVGVKADRSALIVSLRKRGSDARELAEMSYDGKISNTIFARQNSDAYALRDQNQFVIGVRYSGLYPEYEFFDDNHTKLIQGLQDHFAPASMSLTDWSTDFGKLILYVAGGDKVPGYYLYDRQNKNLSFLTKTYEGVDDSEVAEVITIDYKARDGYRVPAILTRPLGWQEDKKYPTIIMPHGGPESYDSVGFDWMAQFFASRGYLVLQPNFRGSDGFGAVHKLAGRGEWGRGVMQHDVTDGLQVLVNAGWADPDRVCIIGGSYGGYAALAGGAFTPDKYACVAAIAPVTDLVRMIYDERRDNGRDSWVVTYWQRLIGDSRSQKEKLKFISPSEHADAFTAPVLLLHGNDDTVVPYHQSKIMERALKRAGKDVTMVKLKGEDHWLSTSETRLATLRELERFVERTIGE